MRRLSAASKLPCFSHQHSLKRHSWLKNLTLQTTFGRNVLPCCLVRTFFSSGWNTPTSSARLHSRDDPLQRKYTERRTFQVSPQQLYEVVSSVEKYKDFLPWCVESTILSRDGNVMEAELTVGFKLFEERYTSRVEVDPNRSVKATSASSNLFRSLTTSWTFEPGSSRNTCDTKFEVDFSFKSELHQSVANLFFDEVSKKMLQAFENRCSQL
eukprot:TRINITY_DN22932_c0_g1_i1.p1 TRINITY_DN22932_c0_g1~~TRINITY_DN22932_c0_g1_i1.p1  ORF type:complete len:212 (-),score=16.50 TRINITY_DN22932_c0_g1_i1:1-636(-)